MNTSYEIVKIETVPQSDPYHADTGGITYTELEIQSDGKVFVTQECNNDSTSFDVWNGVVLTAKIPHVNEKSLREFLTDNEDIQKIVDGMDTKWDGSNMVGCHADESEDLFKDLVEEINSWGDYYSRWSAEDWFGQNSPDELGINAYTTDEEIEKLSKAFEETPEKGNVIDGMRIIVDEYEICEYLKEMRDRLTDEL